jgi:hypothetical protein
VDDGYNLTRSLAHPIGGIHPPVQGYRRRGGAMHMGQLYLISAWRIGRLYPLETGKEGEVV